MLSVVILLLFFFSGFLKTLLLFYNINFPFDLTAISAALLVLSILNNIFIVRVKINKSQTNSLLMLLIFYSWIIITIIYSSSEKYSIIKTINFATNIIAFSYIIFNKNLRILTFLRLNIIITILFGLWYVFISINVGANLLGETQLSVYRVFYLSISYLLGINFLILSTNKNNIFLNKGNDFILSVLILGMMFMIRGRGPLLFSLLFFAIYLVIKIYKTRYTKTVYKIKEIVRFSLTFIIFLVATFSIYINNQKKINNLVSLTVGRVGLLIPKDGNLANMGSSVTARVDLFKKSIDLINADFFKPIFGYGIGSYGIITKGKDERLYPHNIFLEIIVELGLFGFAIFLFYMYFNFFSIKNENYYISNFIILYIFFNMFKSGSLVDFRVNFIFFAILLVPTLRKKITI
jgi:O-antigen ligase